ncbi:hypothetical protein EZV62_001864 [Acer yangbiense]|uniref:Uncharacterized protein n=1 Tax=Acer yangbiense TaxID=1000413 RepID=A0A5C7IVP2_9ROSI|nr:hypothetical protein EZV62_001864 [Acer yangbiense]
MSAMTATTTRRPKWQYPQAPPTPRILQLPRRPRKKPPKTTFPGKLVRERKGKLEALFDQEREFSRGVVPVVLLNTGDECEERRGRVVVVVEEEERESEAAAAVVMEEEKWRFQAEMLRAECNLLRIEREVAVKKMERRRVQVERVLRSAIQTLVSGRNKICEGENVSMVLEQEIKNLAEKLEKLQRRSGVKTLEVKSSSNFDKQATLLQQRLVKVDGMSDEICVKEIREMAEASLSIQSSCRVHESVFSNENCHVEILRRKMEGLSKGMLFERMEEEYGSMLSTNTFAASSASSSKPIEFPDVSSLSIRQLYKEAMSREEKLCSGHCKAIVKRIVEQVRAETEQWSQMQEMLGQVRDEMEELQASRDFWEDRALDSDYQIQSLCSSVQEWRQKTVSSETKVNELQAQVTVLQKEIEWLRKEQYTGASRAKISSPLAREPQNEMEKRVLICRLKENHCHANDSGAKQKEVLREGRRKTHTCSSSSRSLVAPKRSPLGDIGNLSSLGRQNSKAVFPLHCPLHSNREDKL